VFPSYSDGFGLALLEAMACGLSAIASEASIGPEIATAGCGFTSPPGDLDRLVELLRWFERPRDQLPIMGRRARVCTWSNYRSLRAVSNTSTSHCKRCVDHSPGYSEPTPYVLVLRRLLLQPRSSLLKRALPS